MRTLESLKEDLKPFGTIDTFGTAREILHMPEVLYDDEYVKHLVWGTVSSKTWLAVCTTKRILLLNYVVLMGMEQTSVDLESIKSISYQTGVLYGSIEIWYGGSRMLIETCRKKAVKPFVDAVNDAVKALKENPQNEATIAQTDAKAADDDVVSKLERLAALKEKGILTDEEFASQKAKLLAL